MSKRTPEGDAFSLAAMKILNLNETLVQAGNVIARKANQNSARWRVLAAAELKTMTVAEIARSLGLARQSVQRLADCLTKEGMTVFKENPSDKRAMHLVLTPAGKNALTAIQREQRVWANLIGEKIGMKSLKELDTLLRKLILTLKEEPSAEAQQKLTNSYAPAYKELPEVLG